MFGNTHRRRRVMDYYLAQQDNSAELVKTINAQIDDIPIEI